MQNEFDSIFESLLRPVYLATTLTVTIVCSNRLEKVVW